MKTVLTLRCARYFACLLAWSLFGLSQASAATEADARQATPSASVAHFGVLSFRPSAETRKRWQPFIDYLNRSGLKQKLVLNVYTYPELEQAIKDKRVDVVLTQPAHYIVTAYRDGLYSPLATLVGREGDYRLEKFGGVIFKLAQRTDIRRLADLRGRRIAISIKQSLGGYFAQAYELKKLGIDVSADDRLIQTGVPHDKVVEAVLSGKADVGFVRTGVLEGMARDGKLDLGKLAILKADHVPDYPLLLSTQLYPQWALAAMPWADPDLGRQVASATLSLPQGGKVAKEAGIEGFTIPGNYKDVEDMMRAIKAPPFDRKPEVTLKDIWQQHHGSISILTMATSLLLLGLLVTLGRSNRSLRASSQRQKYILDTMGEGLFGIDQSGCITFINPAALHMLRLAEREALGKECHTLFHHHHADGSSYPVDECPLNKTLRDGKDRYVDDWFWRKGGQEGFPVRLTITAEVNKGELTGAIAVFADISERFRTVQALQESEAHANQIIDVAPDGILVVSEAGKIVRTNSRLRQLLGYGPDELCGQPLEVLIPERFRANHGHTLHGYFVAPIARYMGEGRDLFALRKDGTEVAVEIGLAPMDTGHGRLVLANVVDITERLKAKAQIESALHEKTLLLNEVHHRVKNNLQIVASLLSLQSGRVSEPALVELMAESEGRVRAMALMHQVLYERKDFANVELKVYLDRLATLLAQIHSAARRKIVVTVEADDLTMGLTRAIPLGLVVNELLSNAFKHAFDERTGGQVQVELRALDGQDARLSVSDNGRGLPEDWQSAGTLGMQIVTLLSEQIGATLDVTRQPGARFELRFKLRENAATEETGAPSGSG